MLTIISEPRRFYSHGPLEDFLKRLLEENNLTIREACKIAGCSPSVLHGWMQGAYPTGTVIHLKKLCNHYGYTLSEALTGSPDDVLT
jgi:transcriptional regulator with XRE-family HTH domain